MLFLTDSLLFSVLEKDKAEAFMNIARKNGAGGGTIIPAKGTASSAVLRALGLGDKRKDAVLVLTEEESAMKIMEDAKREPSIWGVSALISGKGDKEMTSEYKMITVIVNGGFADDVMDTARKAGATGGTITHARGTAPKDREEKFLNMTIVPEKDMIMILCKSEECEKITDAIRNMDCLKEQGLGILFVQDVKKFVNLSEK